MNTINKSPKIFTIYFTIFISVIFLSSCSNHATNNDKAIINLSYDNETQDLSISEQMDLIKEQADELSSTSEDVIDGAIYDKVGFYLERYRINKGW